MTVRSAKPFESVAIIGAGHGGIQVAAELRRRGFAGRIHLISAESALPYQRPPLSKTFLKPGTEGAMPAPQEFRPRSWFSEQNIELGLGDPVIRLDPDRHEVELRSGRTVLFDHAILATGSSNRPLPVPVLSGQVMTLRDVEDATRVRTTLADASHVAIVGGGFVGLEIASSVRALGKEVTVIEAEDRLLRRGLSENIAAEIHRRHSELGVSVSLSTMVSAVQSHTNPLIQLTLQTGESMSCDVLIAGVGAVPNTDLARSAGLTISDGVEGGVKVDGTLRTSHPAVSAIGDVCSFPLPDGRRIRLESVQNAVDQGRYVATRLLGQSGDYHAVPWFWSDQANSKVQMVGFPGESITERIAVPGKRIPGGVSVWHFNGSRFVGGESIDDNAGHIQMRRIMESGQSISPYEVAQLNKGPQKVR
ncbi:NAD(P)/FAD-dependent oxidoreductase [Rhodococcus sp. NPDC056960]|uniref:NAD(P)/FAD-dependent oxidoreductase n=1 Tax=Rhodococcus sp. NPDC056960 TaxID=3345982 RepID=UPI0036305023